MLPYIISLTVSFEIIIVDESEVARIIKATLNLKHRTLLILIYGAGLRASEVASLSVKDIDGERSVIHIREGKGKKDRYVMLSPFMLSSLRAYWKQCRLQCSGKLEMSPSGKLEMSPFGPFKTNLKRLLNEWEIKDARGTINYEYRRDRSTHNHSESN